MAPNKDIAHDFGKNVRLLRKKKGWTQKDLAKKIGCSQAIIASYEKNEKRPLAAKIMKMVQLFGVSYNDLFGEIPAAKEEKASKLWKRFEEVDKLPPHDKTVLIKMIDGLLEQRKR